jgi:hypothetical protein
MLLQRIGIIALVPLVVMACTSQHYYEGLKAGRKASCLEYPESEYESCIDETETSYREYRSQREEVVGN